jgi:replicative DNA helicase
MGRNFTKLSAASRALELYDIFDGKKDTQAVSTGFKKLDTVLGGGLHDELYIIGGIPSVGKTSFALQMIDNMTRDGTDVLLYTLEMSALSVIAKIICRQAASAGMHGAPKPKSPTVREILYSDSFNGLCNEDKADLRALVAGYSAGAGKRLTIIDQAQSSATDVVYAARALAETTGCKTVVVVDYLQILADEKILSEKQHLDNSVLKLKALCSELHMPIVAISSFNRASYNSPTTMEAFKESGGVEYSADVLLALQYEGVNRKDYSLAAEKNSKPRQVELSILKDRYGEGSARLGYAFYSQCGHFVERQALGGSHQAK